MFKSAILKTVNLLPKGRLVSSVFFLAKDYLSAEGWTSSVKKGMPVDSKGSELPWFTYPFLHFLSGRLTPGLVVLEYGSGNSTIWFSRRVKKIISVEHDDKWYSQIREKLTEIPNVDYLFRDTGTGDYEGEILKYRKEFDIVVIDGRNRVECARNSLSALKDSGVIIWDNSDRELYNEGYEFLLSNGFKRLDFRGLGPINSYSWCTSVFYRSGNCLDL